MPRRKAAIKREILPDPLYHSERLAKFINIIMRRGKKAVAEHIVYSALNEATKRLKKHAGQVQGKKGDTAADVEGAGKVGQVANKEGLEILDKVLNNIRPTVEVKSRRVGGATYQVPIEVNPERGLALAMRMLTNAAKARSEKSMTSRLAAEILEAYEGRGSAVKMRDDIHRMAKANQAFAHYRW
jgi:small subunit ribosomal protein S7